MTETKTKTCTKCGGVKPLSAFSKHRLSKDGHAYQCKECANKRAKIFRHSPSGIYTTLRGNATFFKRKPIMITRKEFIEWYNEQSKTCVYCGIEEKDLEKIDDRIIGYSHRLTVDCKDNYDGYELDNMVLACLRCNYIKSDFLSFEEMKEIAKKYVRPKWGKQLKEQTTKRDEA